MCAQRHCLQSGDMTLPTLLSPKENRQRQLATVRQKQIDRDSADAEGIPRTSKRFCRVESINPNSG